MSDIEQRLRAIDEVAMYEAPATTEAIIRESADELAAERAKNASLRSKLEEAEGADTVLVPRAEVERVTEIANRNEQSAEGDRLAVRLSALREADHA